MSETIAVLVTGASGTLGSAVVPRLAKQGYAVRPMTRSSRAGWVTADLRTGEGLADAVRGVDVIVHLASSPGRPGRTDVAGTRLLLAAAKEAAAKEAGAKAGPLVAGRPRPREHLAASPSRRAGPGVPGGRDDHHGHPHRIPYVA